MASSRAAGPNREEAPTKIRPGALVAQLRTASASFDVRIRDLSSLGARVEAGRLPVPGTIVCLQRGGAALFGVMAWAEDGLGGILFDEELDAQLFGAEAAQAERLGWADMLKHAQASGDMAKRWH